MNTFKIHTLLILILTTAVSESFGQQTIFSAVLDGVKLADRHYDNHEYYEAIELYNNSLRKRREPDLLLKIARSYFNTRQFENAITYYGEFKDSKSIMPIADMIRFGDALCIVKNYKLAGNIYEQAHGLDVDNEMLSQKIWRLKNLQYLYEDSAHFSVRLVPNLNSNASEISASHAGDKLIFTSNRKDLRPIDYTTGNVTAPFYNAYSTTLTWDSTVHHLVATHKPEKFARSLPHKYNVGPVSFFADGTKMVYVASSSEASSDGSRSLGLHFASLNGTKWKSDGHYTYNSNEYSITDVTTNSDGNIMFFSSDMKGGAGGKDIYVTRLLDSKWSKPVNVGDPVNTSRNEAFPYLHKNTTLYFSSDGHPGLGALDIFRTTILQNSFAEPENVGYPLNSHRDDFGISFDSVATHGYLSSDRNGISDDIYEFDMDLLTYPLTITGILKFTKYAWSDAREFEPGANAHLVVVDSWRNTTVCETTSSQDGSFIFSIPYFSRFHILVTDDEGATHMASLEIAKYRNDASTYELVVVKELFGQEKEEK
jgi:hypothetical protein